MSLFSRPCFLLFLCLSSLSLCIFLWPQSPPLVHLLPPSLPLTMSFFPRVCILFEPGFFPLLLRLQSTLWKVKEEPLVSCPHSIVSWQREGDDIISFFLRKRKKKTLSSTPSTPASWPFVSSFLFVFSPTKKLLCIFFLFLLLLLFLTSFFCLPYFPRCFLCLPPFVFSASFFYHCFFSLFLMLVRSAFSFCYSPENTRTKNKETNHRHSLAICIRLALLSSRCFIGVVSFSHSIPSSRCSIDLFQSRQASVERYTI